MLFKHNKTVNVNASKMAEVRLERAAKCAGASAMQQKAIHTAEILIITNYSVLGV